MSSKSQMAVLYSADWLTIMAKNSVFITGSKFLGACFAKTTFTIEKKELLPGCIHGGINSLAFLVFTGACQTNNVLRT